MISENKNVQCSMLLLHYNSPAIQTT